MPSGPGETGGAEMRSGHPAGDAEIWSGHPAGGMEMRFGYLADGAGRSGEMAVQISGQKEESL